MKLLLAADGSEFTTSSLEFLARLPFPVGSEMSIVTVVPHVELLADGHSSTASDDVQNSARIEAEQMLQKTLERASKLGLSASQTVRTGNVTDEIIEHGVETEIDLAVVGSHGHRGFKRFLLGSDALKVVTYAPFSVLIVRPTGTTDTAGDDPSETLRVLVATDGSKTSSSAIAQFAELAAERWCTIKVMTVLELITMFRMDIRQRLTESWRRSKADAMQHLKETASTLASIAVEVETQIVEAASVSEAVLNAADEFRADLILVGGTGKGHIERVLLGSTADKIARHARCAVWVGRSSQ